MNNDNRVSSFTILRPLVSIFSPYCTESIFDSFFFFSSSPSSGFPLLLPSNSALFFLPLLPSCLNSFPVHRISVEFVLAATLEPRTLSRLARGHDLKQEALLPPGRASPFPWKPIPCFLLFLRQIWMCSPNGSEEYSVSQASVQKRRDEGIVLTLTWSAPRIPDKLPVPYWMEKWLPSVLYVLDWEG